MTNIMIHDSGETTCRKDGPLLAEGRPQAHDNTIAIHSELSHFGRLVLVAGYLKDG